MKFRALTLSDNEELNWDWDYGKGLQNYATDSLAVAYDLKSKIWSWVGDCFFALEDGIDWKNRLGLKNQKALLDGDIKKIITSQSGVQELLLFDSYVEGRTYHATANIKTIFNQTIEVRI